MEIKPGFNEVVDKVFDSFKKITPALIAIAIACGGILFLPSQILTKLHIKNFSDTYGSILGAVFLLSSALIITIILSEMFSWTRKKYKGIRLRKMLEQRLLKLSSEHIKILVDTYKKKSQSTMLRVAAGTTIYLINGGFIGHATQISDGETLEYFLQPWVKEYFDNHPDLVAKDGSIEKR